MQHQFNFFIREGEIHASPQFAMLDYPINLTITQRSKKIIYLPIYYFSCFGSFSGYPQMRSFGPHSGRTISCVALRYDQRAVGLTMVWSERSFCIFCCSPRFRWATIDRSDHTIVRPTALWSDRSATQEIVRPECGPKDLWSDHRATQSPLIRPLCDDQTVVRPKTWCDPSATQKICATLVRPTPLLIKAFLNTCHNPLLFA